jgi:hypothetical protein
LPALVIVNRLAPGTRQLLMFLAIGAVFVFERLAPFAFESTPGGFDLWPFLGWMAAGMPIAVRDLFAFLFFCSALIWLLREAGMQFDAAIAVVVAGVLAIEVIQMWQPEHAASVTDPLLALAAGLLLRLVDSATRRHSLRLR